MLTRSGCSAASLSAAQAPSDHPATWGRVRLSASYKPSAACKWELASTAASAETRRPTNCQLYVQDRPVQAKPSATGAQSQLFRFSTACLLQHGGCHRALCWLNLLRQTLRRHGSNDVAAAGTFRSTRRMARHGDKQMGACKVKPAQPRIGSQASSTCTVGVRLGFPIQQIGCKQAGLR